MSHQQLPVEQVLETCEQPGEKLLSHDALTRADTRWHVTAASFSTHPRGLITTTQVRNTELNRAESRLCNNKDPFCAASTSLLTFMSSLYLAHSKNLWRRSLSSFIQKDLPLNTWHFCPLMGFDWRFSCHQMWDLNKVPVNNPQSVSKHSYFCLFVKRFSVHCKIQRLLNQEPDWETVARLQYFRISCGSSFFHRLHLSISVPMEGTQNTVNMFF